MNTQTHTRIRMTPMERAAGRLMRAPDHPGGDGGNQDGGGNNDGGNSDDSGGSSQNQNNSGQSFDPTSFWNGSGDDTGSASGGESASGSSSGQQGGGNEGENFGRAIEGLRFDDVFSREAIEALAENRDPSQLNQGLQAFGQNVTRQAFVLSAKLLQAYGPQLAQQIRSELQAEFGNRDNDAELVSAIPSAANPAVMRSIKPIFDRALQITKGDRKGAIAMTKEMLAFQTQQLSPDLGLNHAPADPADAIAGGGKDWVQELLGR